MKILNSVKGDYLLTITVNLLKINEKFWGKLRKRFLSYILSKKYLKNLHFIFSKNNNLAVLICFCNKFVCLITTARLVQQKLPVAGSLTIY